MTVEVSRRDIEDVFSRISPHVRRTPTLQLGDVLGGGFELILKLEQVQVTGSFKARGAFSLLTSAPIPHAGVVAASGGNFGIAVAYAASRLGHKATIYVPGTSPSEKIDRIGTLGADVRVIPGYYDDAREKSMRFASESGALQAHAYDQHLVVAGQGTLAREIQDQADVDLVLAAVGGGGLIGGIASWFRDGALVVGVEPENCRSLHAALEAGHPVDVEVSGLTASSLGARRIGEHAWAARTWIDRSVLVTDEEIRDAQRWLWSTTRLAVEPAAATPLAALRTGAVMPEPGSAVIAVLSGGNVDPGSVV